MLLSYVCRISHRNLQHFGHLSTFCTCQLRLAIVFELCAGVWGGWVVLSCTGICLFHVINLGWSHMLSKNQRAGCSFIFYFFLRQSQPMQWSHPAEFVGLAANFEVQPTTTTTLFSRLTVLVRGRFALGEAISLKCYLVIVLVFGSCGTLALSTASCVCIAYFFANDELFIQSLSFCKTMANDKMRNQCKSLSPSTARLRMYAIQPSFGSTCYKLEWKTHESAE